MRYWRSMNGWKGRSSMRIAYADPPYIGQARKHYRNDPSGVAPAEVDHAALVAQLEGDYDGWALSCSSQSLRRILPLCPESVRVAAWVKPFCSWKSCNPSYSWEPIILRQPRKANYPSVRDYVSVNMTTQTGTHGAKPAQFCYWLFDALNMVASDELVDLYPGSGAVMRAWLTWRAQAPETRRRKTARVSRPQLWEASS